MTSVGITELKAHLSEYLRRTQNGERFYVTYRGVEVAELGPPDPVRATLLRMAARGEVEWSGETPRLPDGFHPNPGDPCRTWSWRTAGHTCQKRTMRLRDPLS